MSKTNSEFEARLAEMYRKNGEFVHANAALRSEIRELKDQLRREKRASEGFQAIANDHSELIRSPLKALGFAIQVLKVQIQRRMPRYLVIKR